MSHCCGLKEKPKQKEIRQPEIKGRGNQESFWKKLLRAFGLEVESKNLTGGN